MAVPIWKDHFSNLGAVASIEFRIRVNSTTIYQGKAVRAASSGNLYVRINDICADYMAQKAPAVPNVTPSQMTFPVSFTVQKFSGGSWSTVETVAFNDEWSYDPSFDPSVLGHSFPITGRVDLRQTVFQTMNAAGTVTVAAKYGTTNRSISRTTATTSDGTAFQNGLIHAGAAYVTFPCPTYEVYSSKTLTQFTIGTAVYKVTTKCSRYVLYYRNPFGGYDHLLIEGNARKRRSVARDTFVADYDNTAQRREEWNYQNENTETWELHTGLLTDEESARMPYLLESTEVYFCDLTNASVIIPAVIATDSVDIQSFKSNGRRMNDYSFEVRIAQKEYRR